MITGDVPDSNQIVSDIYPVGGYWINHSGRWFSVYKTYSDAAEGDNILFETTRPGDATEWTLQHAADLASNGL